MTNAIDASMSLSDALSSSSSYFLFQLRPRYSRYWNDSVVRDCWALIALLCRHRWCVPDTLVCTYPIYALSLEGTDTRAVLCLRSALVNGYKAEWLLCKGFARDLHLPVLKQEQEGRGWYMWSPSLLRYDSIVRFQHTNIRISPKLNDK